MLFRTFAVHITLKPMTSPIQSELIKVLGSLAAYNDKGIGWSGHTPAQATAQRAAMLSKVRALIGEVGLDALPKEFLQVLESGAVEVDYRGDFVDMVRKHLEKTYGL